VTKCIVNIKAELRVGVKREGGWFIASCPLLDVCSQGRTRGKALANLEEGQKPQVALESAPTRSGLSGNLRYLLRSG
jgi:predicted RNase H-like HicB family nuclease